VKISNLMRVLGNEAIQDPTKVEQDVRQQIAERLQTHISANQARKLTPEQKKEKVLKKIEEDRAADTLVAVFRIEDFSRPQWRFKVEVNANQMHLTGCAVATSDMSVVVVEGGTADFCATRLAEHVAAHTRLPAVASDAAPPSDAQARGPSNGIKS